MTKKAVVILTVVLTLAFSSASFAASMSFSKISVEVPDGWTASEKGISVVLVAPDKVASIGIIIDKTAGFTDQALAEAMSARLKGTKPTAEDGGYSFTFPANKQGKSSKAIMLAEGNEFVMLTVTGNHPQISTILKSIKHGDKRYPANWTK
ncbi:MAG: hypothetical protein ACLQBD_03215 [Syntrophobacteraceae bacterium]